MNSEQKLLLDGATSELIDYVVRYENLSEGDAEQVVYSSKLLKKMQNEQTMLYREGPVYLYDLLCEERELPKRKDFVH